MFIDTPPTTPASEGHSFATVTDLAGMRYSLLICTSCRLVISLDEAHLAESKAPCPHPRAKIRSDIRTAIRDTFEHVLGFDNGSSAKLQQHIYNNVVAAAENHVPDPTRRPR